LLVLVLVLAASFLVLGGAPAAATKHSDCIPPSVSFPDRPIIAAAPPAWGCKRIRELWHHAGDGNGGLTFRLFGHRWQCVTIARPDHGRHTTMGCYHVHWKFHGDVEHMPGRPVVRFFLPFQAD
jgi:hypothetical protein